MVNEAKEKLPALNLAYKVMMMIIPGSNNTLSRASQLIDRSHSSDQALSNPPRAPINLLERVLDRKGRIAVFAEIKRASPSKVFAFFANDVRRLLRTP